MLEDLGPDHALKRSGTLFKQTWGENIVAQLGFGLLGFVALLPGLLLIVARGRSANVGARPSPSASVGVGARVDRVAS